MRNPILSSTIVVFIFWWLVSVVWGLNTYGFPDSGIFLLIAIKALVLGTGAFILAIGLSAAWRWARKGWHLPTQERGIHCTIGLVPGVFHWQRCRKAYRVDPNRWPRVVDWMGKGQGEYIAAFQAVLDVMGARPTFPASPTKGGHGDATLLEHSLNVAETGLELFPSWRFRRKSGDIMLQDRSLTPQDRDIALLILIGHDIGKLEAFKVDGDRVSIKKRFHDREGGRILATLKEVWALPEDDRKALIAAVTHEHHPQDLPIHTGENVRLLLEFLIDVDREAARREEGRVAVEEAEDNNHQADEALWAWFLDYLSKPGTINGREQRFRAGFKSADGCLYLNEPNVRTACAEQFFNNPLQADVQLGDGRYALTQELLRILEARGVLICKFGTQQFSYKNALFKVVSSNSEGRVLGEWQVAFVVALGEHMPSGLKKLDPAPNPPRIVQALYGTRSLRASTHDEADSAPPPPPPPHSSTRPNAEPAANPCVTNALASDSQNTQPPSPVDPYAHLGGLGKALLRGMRQQGREPAEDQQGCLTLMMTEAAEFSLKGGIPHKGYFEAFLKLVQTDEAVMRGVEIISDESGAIQSVRVRVRQEFSAPAQTDPMPSAEVENNPDLQTPPASASQSNDAEAAKTSTTTILDIDAWSTPASGLDTHSIPKDGDSQATLSLSEGRGGALNPDQNAPLPADVELPPTPVLATPIIENVPIAPRAIEAPLPASLNAFEIEGLDSFDFGGKGLEQLNEKVKADRKNRKRKSRQKNKIAIDIATQLNDAFSIDRS